MHILVIGGNGYLGSKVVRRLVEEEHSIVCTKRDDSDLSRVSDVMNNVEWIPANIDSVICAMKIRKFDWVMNMSCHYGRNNDSYREVIVANLEFPLKVFSAAIEYGTKSFLTIGTGLPDDFNMYSLTKKVLGEFGEFFSKRNDVVFCHLLLEMFYGADEPHDRFLPSIITKMIKGELVETTEGKQCRDIIEVKDVVDAIMMIFNHATDGYQEIAIGTGVAPSISEVVDYIWEQTGKKSEIKKGVIPMRKDEPDCVADVGRIGTICKWNPIAWKLGITNMIKEIEKQMGKEYEDFN